MSDTEKINLTIVTEADIRETRARRGTREGVIPWTAEEDAILMNLVAEGKSWKDISIQLADLNLYLPNPEQSATGKPISSPSIPRSAPRPAPLPASASTSTSTSRSRSGLAPLPGPLYRSRSESRSRSGSGSGSVASSAALSGSVPHPLGPLDPEDEDGKAVVYIRRTSKQCAQRYTRVLQPGIRKGSWSREEDAVLRAAIKQFGIQAWATVSRQLGNRTDIQCRTRWLLWRAQGKCPFQQTTQRGSSAGKRESKHARPVQMPYVVHVDFMPGRSDPDQRMADAQIQREVQSHIQRLPDAQIQREGKSQIQTLADGQIQRQVHSHIPHDIQNHIQRQVQSHIQREIQNHIQRLPDVQIQREVQSHIQRLEDGQIQRQTDGQIQREMQNQVQREMQSHIQREMQNHIQREMQNRIRREIQNHIQQQVQNHIQQQVQNHIQREIQNHIQRHVQSHIQAQLQNQSHGQDPNVQVSSLVGSDEDTETMMAMQSDEETEPFVFVQSDEDTATFESEAPPQSQDELAVLPQNQVFPHEESQTGLLQPQHQPQHHQPTTAQEECEGINPSTLDAAGDSSATPNTTRSSIHFLLN